MHYLFTVRVGSKDINCRAFTLREYKDLLEAHLNDELERVVLDILDNCSDAKDLSKHEAELLLIKIWAHSLGEVNHEHDYTCSCGKTFKVPMNFMHAAVTGESDLIYPLANFKLKLKYPKIFEDKNTAQMVACCIDYIIVDGTQIKVEDLSEVEINDLYSAITVEDITKIAALLLKPTIEMGIPISCECGESSVHVIRGFKEFFKLL